MRRAGFLGRIADLRDELPRREIVDEDLVRAPAGGDSVRPSSSRRCRSDPRPAASGCHTTVRSCCTDAFAPWSIHCFSIAISVGVRFTAPDLLFGGGISMSSLMQRSLHDEALRALARHERRARLAAFDHQLRRLHVQIRPSSSSCCGTRCSSSSGTDKRRGRNRGPRPSAERPQWRSEKSMRSSSLRGGGDYLRRFTEMRIGCETMMSTVSVGRGGSGDGLHAACRGRHGGIGLLLLLGGLLGGFGIRRGELLRLGGSGCGAARLSFARLRRAARRRDCSDTCSPRCRRTRACSRPAASSASARSSTSLGGRGLDRDVELLHRREAVAVGLQLDGRAGEFIAPCELERDLQRLAGLGFPDLVFRHARWSAARARNR